MPFVRFLGWFCLRAGQLLSVLRTSPFVALDSGAVSVYSEPRLGWLQWDRSVERFPGLSSNAGSTKNEYFTSSGGLNFLVESGRRKTQRGGKYKHLQLKRSW